MLLALLSFIVFFDDLIAISIMFSPSISFSIAEHVRYIFVIFMESILMFMYVRV